MIVMINERNGHKTRFKNYWKLYNHLDNHQRVRVYNKPNRLIDDWVFACHSYSRVMALYEFISLQETNAKGTTESQQPILEISHARLKKPTIMTVTPELDVESLLEDWCRRWCETYGYKLVEIQDDDGILHVKRT